MLSPTRTLKGHAGQLVQRSPDSRLEIRRATMATFPTEAIVNATDRLVCMNTANLPSASFQIVDAAGPELKRHLKHKHAFGLRVGEALASPGFGLTNCRFVIHVNGPNYRIRTRRSILLLKQLLADCYRRCREEAHKSGVKSIAFPAISTGRSLGWPRNEASVIGARTVRAWLRHPIHGKKRREVVEKVRVLADPVGRQAHQEGAWCAAFREIWPKVLMPSRRRPRVACATQSLEDQFRERYHRNLASTMDGQPSSLATDVDKAPSGIDNSLAGNLRRSTRTRRRPRRYGE